jgi:hypothetical protein
MTEETMSLSAFRASRQDMPASQFGNLIGDAAWEDEPDSTRFLVYEGGWYIEICDDGRFQLVLENQCWITGPDKSLDDLEVLLHEFATDAF